ncbi:hypothetical protein FB45DRAFT_844654, partial [Roridomyces roridus]
MDVPSLRKQLSEISEAIQQQKMVLRDLEQRQTTVQGQLNALLDPVTRMPPEIASEIFVQCLPEGYTSVSPSQPPTIFLHVSRSWKDIALSTPALWTSLTDEAISNADQLEVFERQLTFSRNLPLSLSLGCRKALALEDAEY